MLNNIARKLTIGLLDYLSTNEAVKLTYFNVLITAIE